MSEIQIGTLHHFPHEDPSHPVMRCCQLDALKELAQEPWRWQQRSELEMLASALGLRDAYLALRQGSCTDADVAASVRAVAGSVGRLGAVEVGGLSVSFYPTKSHIMLRFVKASLLQHDWRPFFACPLERLPQLAAVFVDPEEFCYRTFENIIPLDSMLTVDNTALELRPNTVGSSTVLTFALHGSSEALAMLRGLDALDLYVPALNAGSRGGGRFIFHGAALAEALTKAVHNQFPPALLSGFVHVNPIFRCNRFTPTDAPFRAHYDSPYRDPVRHHISRYTVLVYLTGGEGSPALRVHDTDLNTIAPMTCVIFDQRYKHEGWPYHKGNKVFLRSELIFEEPDVTDNPALGALFSKACYMTGESMFAHELAPYTHDAYDRVASAHWQGLAETSPTASVPFVHKNYRDVHFVTNGYDFWFPESELSLCECAALAILDYFNCKLADTPFRKLCTSEVLNRPASSVWIPAFLATFQRETYEKLMGRLTKDVLFPEPESVDPHVTFPRRLADYEKWSNYGKMTRNEEVVELYTEQQNVAKALVFPAPIMLMGQEIFLDESKFVVEGDKIYVASHTTVRPLHFASMSYSEYEPSDAVKTEVEIGTPFFLLPPLLFCRTHGCVHIMLDFFRNTWMVNHHEATAHVPKIKYR